MYRKTNKTKKKLFILFFICLSLTNKFLALPLLNPLKKNLGAATGIICKSCKTLPP